MLNKTPQAYSTFDFISKTHIASLQTDVEHYRHRKTGADHYHFAAADKENVFLVALKTIPKDDTGVAHILEHTALCGSKNYPVRDPFFMMTRRSLNTFMNAFTSSDWTAYPFASLNEKDFDNLLSVYLDAVFFSNIDPLDFAQEGHRLDLEPSNDDINTSPSEADPDGGKTDTKLEKDEHRLVIKGVVYNEMKGAMASVTSQLWQAVGANLYPTTTYRFNSGGEPTAIPDLSYQELKAFYKTHYHPSNAIFMTYGDRPANVLQETFEEKALKHFDMGQAQYVDIEQRFTEPKSVSVPYAIEGDNLDQSHHLVLAWLLDESSDPLENLKVELLSELLLGNSSAPLMKALETTNLAKAPSPLCGADSSQKEMVFICGVDGCSEDDLDAVEALIIDTLTQVSKQGFNKDDIATAVHQLELSQRSVSQSYPHGLSLMMTAMSPACHRGDVSQMLDLDNTLVKLADKLSDENFTSNLIKEKLLDNKHRVRVHLRPDSSLTQQNTKAETTALAEKLASMSSDKIEQIKAFNKELAARQAQADDESILPKVEVSDVPKEGSFQFPAESDNFDSDKQSRKLRAHTCYKSGTNGLVHQTYLAPLPDSLVSDQDKMFDWMAVSGLIPELGYDTKSYLDSQREQASVCAGIGCGNQLYYKQLHYDQLHQSADKKEHATVGLFSIGCKGLAHNASQMNELLLSVFSKARFDETERVAELITQIRASKLRQITGNGHSLAMTAASAAFAPLAALSHKRSGLGSLARLAELDESSDAVAKMLDNAKAAHSLVLQESVMALTIADRPGPLTDSRNIHNQLAEYGLRSDSIQLSPSDSVTHTNDALPYNKAYTTSTAVSFCAEAYAAVPQGHIDAPKLAVLSQFLRNEILHTSIREKGGAYGGGASYDGYNGLFRFYSYRDPRLLETFADFDRAVEWLASHTITQQKLDEAILSTIGGIDRSESPAGLAKRSFYQQLQGRTPDVLASYREGVLSTNANDLKLMGEKYLQNPSSRAVVTSTEILADANKNLAAEKRFKEIVLR